MTPGFGSPLSRALCLRYVMRDPIAFRAYWTPQATKRPFTWRYYFSPATLALDRGDAALYAGRSSGKSIGVLEPELVRHALMSPGEETVLTAFRRLHVRDRMERVIDYLMGIRFFRVFFYKRIVRSPVYEIRWRNDHVSYGICVDLAARIVDPQTGYEMPLRTVERQQRVLSAGTKGQVEAMPVAAVSRSGVRAVVTVRTASGRSIVVTPAHRLLTDEGWQPARDCVARRIAVLQTLPEPLEPVRMPDEAIDLLAILLADGTLTRRQIEFYKEDPEVVRRAQRGARWLGSDIQRVRLRSGRTGRYTLRRCAVVWTWLTSLGVGRARAPAKVIPSAVYRLDQHGLRRFLCALWMTDGFVNPVNGPGLAMASEAFVRAVQHLLLRFGIQSRVAYRPNGTGRTGVPQHAWELVVYSAHWARFAETIDLWGPRQAKLQRLVTGFHKANGAGWPRAVAVLPVMGPAWDTLPWRTRLARLAPWWPDPGPMRSRYSPRALVRGRTRAQTVNPSHIVAWAQATGLQDAPMVRWWTSPDLWWDPVVAIEPAEAREVGDVEIPVHHNFVANDIVVHNSVGEDHEAKQAQGKHASLIAVEEGQQYEQRAYMKLNGARDPRGSRMLMIGVPDGRLETPFRMADTEFDSFEGRRFHVSRRNDPYWDRTAHGLAADLYGDDDSDLFGQEVDAIWGSPAWSAWNLDHLYACVDEVELPPDDETAGTGWVVACRSISGRFYRTHQLSPEAACSRLPGRKWAEGRVVLAADIGYSQPTEIGILQQHEARWYLIARISLTTRMEHDDQAAIFAHLGELYQADQIAIDTTDGEGRAIARTLEQQARWAPQLVGGEMVTPIMRVGFNERDTFDFTRDPDTGEVKPVVDLLKYIAVRVLRRLFARRTLLITKDEDLISEFNQERESRLPDGTIIIRTPQTVHIPEMLRVFAVVLFRAERPVPPTVVAPTLTELTMAEGPGLWDADDEDADAALPQLVGRLWGG